MNGPSRAAALAGRAAGDVMSSLRFFTRLPLPTPETEPPDWAEIAWSAPLAGAIVGAIGGLALLVRDYDEAKSWFTQKLGFVVVEDTMLGADKRWLVLAPPGAAETRLLLAQAATAEQDAAIGNQAGGRVFLFLNTDDFARDHRAYTERGVKFLEEPRHEAYGTVAVFEDLYGNRWDLIQPKGMS